MLLSCENIKKSFGDNVIIKNATFGIQEKEKVAIVGVNGAGKTTLFNILTKSLSYDDGTLSISKNLDEIGYLTQMLNLDSDSTIYESLVSVFDELIKLENTIRDLENQIANEGENASSCILKKYSDFTHKFDESLGYEYKSRVKGVIKGLGFKQEDYDKKVSVLSGGEKSRIALGKLLLKEPDLLLMDEPTNHLDINSIEWLEEYLKNYPKSVIIISHDRYFINKFCTKIIEIENGNTKTYQGDYTFYVTQKEIDRQVELSKYNNQQNEIKRQEDVIKLLKSFNREKSVKRARSREKLLDKVQRLEKPENLPTKMRLKIKPKTESGNDVLSVNKLKKLFGSRTLFTDVDFSIQKKEKVCLIGPNGSGKSTIIKCILNEMDYDNGTIKLGANVKLGYYDQEYIKLDETKTIFDEIYDTYPKLTVTEIRNALALFMFIGDDVFKTINTLSGGEKGRVALAKIMLSEGNFLMLDEPTNHLDMFSKDILEDALNNYEGTIFFISHDRYFINNIATKIIKLSEDGVKVYLGDYDYYIEKSKENIPVIYEKLKEQSNWKQDKESKSDERKRKAKTRRLEEQIEKFENMIINIDETLKSEDVSKDYVKITELYAEKTEIENNLEKLLEEYFNTESL